MNGQNEYEKMLNITNYQKNANHLTPVRMAIIKMFTNNKHYRGCVEKGTPPTLLAGM